MGRPVMQFQILAQNPERAAEFYTALFDWKVNTNNPMNYRQIDTGSDRGIQGGIWPAPPEGRGLMQLFVEVEKVADTVKRAQQMGGTVIIPPQALPEGHQMAVLLDPEGIPFGIYTPAKKTKARGKR
jgi:Predicted enzyme related to lactoylglutathione lyase